MAFPEPIHFSHYVPVANFGVSTGISSVPRLLQEHSNLEYGGDPADLGRRSGAERRAADAQRLALRDHLVAGRRREPLALARRHSARHLVRDFTLH